MTVIDLFAGCGGWDLAARELGLDPLGIELNPDACATREAVGLATINADIAALDPADFAPCEGFIASPPCQDFSVAGKGAGRDGDRGRLVEEVPRWVDALRPRWVACEQVPPVLPIWREFAHRLEQWGYRTWCGLLSSERYGVPQTRERAFLLASLDGPVLPPEPTHQEYRHGEPARREVNLFGDLEPWVSMADALGWGMTERPLGTITSALTKGARETLIRERDRGAWLVDRRTNSRGPGGTQVPIARRPCDTPAPTVDTKAGARWVIRSVQTVNGGPLAERDVDDPAFTVGSRADQWVFDRPATTIAGAQSENAIRLTLAEGLTLQGFPPDYPVQGTKTAQWLQVGNAVPPPLALAVLRQVVPAMEAAA